MHDAGEPAHGGDAACLVDRIGWHQLFIRKSPRQISEYRGIFYEDLTVDTERRPFTAWIDLEIGVGFLLLLREQDWLCLVRHTGFFETDMRCQKTSAGTKI